MLLAEWLEQIVSLVSVIKGLVGQEPLSADVVYTFTEAVGFSGCREMQLRSQILKVSFDAPRCCGNRETKKATRVAAFRRKKKDRMNRRSKFVLVKCQAQRDDGLRGTGRSFPRAGSRGFLSFGRVQSSDSNDAWRLTSREEDQVEEVLEGLVGRDQQRRVSAVKTFRYLLQACSKKKSLVEAKAVHGHIIESGLESDVLLGESLVCTLVKCGSIVDALQVFCRLSLRTVSSWNTIISGYNKAGLPREAMKMYHQMEEDGMQPNKNTFLTVLKACSTLQDVGEGKRIHANVLKHRCESEVAVANSLIHMYAKCGSILDARHVFDTMPERSVVSWNSMITGYAEHGKDAKAWQLYVQMQGKGVRPDARTFVGMLKACSSIASREVDILVEGEPVKVEALKKCREVYVEILETGELDMFVGSSLVNMFSACGSIMDARYVFDAMSQRNVVAWNAMIAGYADNEQCEKALLLYSQMQQECVQPTDRTFVSVLKACASLAASEPGSLINEHLIKVQTLRIGEEIHRKAVQSSYGSDHSVGSQLVYMYANCGSIIDAEQVFNAMAIHDVLSWNAMILAHTEQKQYEEALHLYCRMQVEGSKPDSRTFVSLLKACSHKAASEPSTFVEGQQIKVHSLQWGKELHDGVVCFSFESDVFVGNSLISMYASCGSMTDAEHVFGALPGRDVVSWNALIAGYADVGKGEVALQLFEKMKQTGVAPDARTFVSVLKGCSSLAAREANSLVNGQYVKVETLQQVKNLYDVVRAKGYANSFVANTAIDLYAECGSIVDARQVFDTLSQRDVVSWNAMISGYAEQNQGAEAWKLFSQMQEGCISPNTRTFVSVLKALGSLAAQESNMLVNKSKSDGELLPKLKAVHAEVSSRGYESNIFVMSNLVKMYATYGSIHDAQHVFDSVPHHNIVMWNAMIAGYAQQQYSEKALQLYSQMQEQSIRPDAWTFVSVLKAYGDIAVSRSSTVVDKHAGKGESLQKGKALYAEVVEHGYASDIFVGNTLIDMFARLGSILDARQVFDSLSKCNVVTWNAMIAGYAHQEQGEEALQIYAQMQAAGLRPEETTFLCILRACSTTGVLDVCQQIHQDVAQYGFSSSITVTTALIHAYGKCGNMTGAQTVFDSLGERGVVAWNALLAGYARQGQYERSLECFNDMQVARMKPDAVTFVSLLSACSHAGLVDQGLSFFQSMSRDHGITAELEHYVSMVDLLGRAGLFNEVQELLSHMPMLPSLSLWLSLLAACRKYSNVELGRQAFDRSVLLDPRQSATYLLMATIYSQAGMWDMAKQIDELRHNAGAQKSPGRTWIEHRQKVHMFTAGNRRQLDGTAAYLDDTLAALSSEAPT